LSIFIITWNVSGFNPKDPELISDLMSPLIQKLSASPPSLFSVNLQEVIELKGFVGAMAQWAKEKPIVNKWSNAISYWLNKLEGGYTLIGDEMLVGLLTLNFAHNSIRDKIQAAPITEDKTALNGTFGHKGFLVSKFTFDDKNIALINAHMNSGEGAMQERDKLIENLYNALCSPYLNDIVLLYGDLNMRVIVDQMNYNRAMKEGKVFNSAIDWDYLYSVDEVKVGLHPILTKEFFEQTVTFPMTYKLDKSSGEPRYVSDRVASWTDRIFLWFSKKRRMDIEVPVYNYSPVVLSDHFPVHGLYAISFRDFDQQMAIQKYGAARATIPVQQYVGQVMPGSYFQGFNPSVTTPLQYRLAQPLPSSMYPSGQY